MCSYIHWAYLATFKFGLLSLNCSLRHQTVIVPKGMPSIQTHCLLHKLTVAKSAKCALNASLQANTVTRQWKAWYAWLIATYENNLPSLRSNRRAKRHLYYHSYTLQHASYYEEELSFSLCRVLVAAVDKSTTNPELRFFNNCFGDGFDEGNKSRMRWTMKHTHWPLMHLLVYI